MNIDVGKYKRGDLLIVGYSTFQGRLSTINFNPKTLTLDVTFEHLAEKKISHYQPTGSEKYKLWNLQHRLDGYNMSFTIKSAKEKQGLPYLTTDTGETLTLIPQDHPTMLLSYEIMFQTA